MELERSGGALLTLVNFILLVKLSLIRKSSKLIIEAKDQDGWTALLSSASGGYETVVQQLLDMGANI
jgi:ankyrin repeat protein